MRKLRSNIQRAIDYLAYNRMRRKLRRVPVTLGFYLRGKEGIAKTCMSQTYLRTKRLLDVLVEHCLAVKTVLENRRGTIYEPVSAEDWKSYEQACMASLSHAGTWSKANRKGV
jgi:hypothetical protein